MLYINLTTLSVQDFRDAEISRANGHEVESRRDWETLERVTEVCDMLDQELYMVEDSGNGCLPRFDIVRKPRIGDKVSYGFNGDMRPDGEIASISKTMKLITTTTGNKYYRRGKTSTWKLRGTWSMCFGHHTATNQEF